MSQINPADQQELNRLQQLSQSLETIMQQRISMEAQAKELDFAIKELESAGADAVVYKSVGGLFIKSKQSDILEQSKDKKETLKMRVKSLQLQEDRLKSQYDQLRDKLQAKFK